MFTAQIVRKLFETHKIFDFGVDVTAPEYLDGDCVWN